ncbi:hypothetical protein [Brevibacillus borstelensis]
MNNCIDTKSESKGIASVLMDDALFLYFYPVKKATVLKGQEHWEQETRFRQLCLSADVLIIQQQQYERGFSYSEKYQRGGAE